MARPKKIKKKKSFMFTSRHYSALGVVAFLMSVCTLAAVFFCIGISYSKRGDAGINLAGVGLFSVLANITGAILSTMSLNERDIYKWVPKSAFVIHILCLVIWALLVLMGYFYKA